MGSPLTAPRTVVATSARGEIPRCGWKWDGQSSSIVDVFAQSLIGTMLLGRYRVEDVLGIGGMGVVVRAVHTDLDTQVAIKFLLPNMVESASVVQRFLREAQATVKLKGEHVVKVIDVGKMPDGAPFMVMEYLSGADLGQVLKAHGAQPANVACDLLMQICEGMSEAHALGIIHRDVKPSNFFVTRGPDGSPLVKILDFGISKTPLGTDMQQLTGTQSMVGTPAYMAPEHMRAASRADQRSDLWSMGVVLYQLLTNRLPFDGESYADLCLKVVMEQPAPITVPLPPGLGEVLLRCLEKDAAQRYQSVAQLAYALVPYCSDPMMATAAAERCGRILEAPRGPRAPTLGAGESLGQTPLPPYASSHASGHASGHRSGHNSHLHSHPSSLSAGAGEMGQRGGKKKSRAAIYAVGTALVLIVGVGLGVVAAGGGDEGAPAQRATQGGAVAPVADEPPAPAPVPVGSAAAAVAPAPIPVGSPAAATPAAPEPAPVATGNAAGELQGGLPEPAKAADEAKAADAAKAEAAKAQAAKAEAAKTEPAKPVAPVKKPAAKKPAAVKKPPATKKKPDLFQSRE
jgi:eukaryotic-like serine/threonine-protein kinase